MCSSVCIPFSCHVLIDVKLLTHPLFVLTYVGRYPGRRSWIEGPQCHTDPTVFSLDLRLQPPYSLFCFPLRELESRDPFPFWIAALISLKATVCPVGPLLAMFFQYITSTEARRGLGPPSVLPLCHYFYPMPLCTFTLSHTSSGSTCFQFKLPSESHLEYCHVPHHACLPYR